MRTSIQPRVVQRRAMTVPRPVAPRPRWRAHASRPSSGTVVVVQAALQTQQDRRHQTQPGKALSILGTLSLLAVNAFVGPKTPVLPLLLNPLAISFLVKSWQDQQAKEDTPTAATPEQGAEPVTLVVAEVKSPVQLQMEAALRDEATRLAQSEAAEAIACMNRALRHTNANLSKQLREERVLRMQQRLRLERMQRELAHLTAPALSPYAPPAAAAAGGRPAAPSPLLAVTCDPAVERAVLQMVQGEELRAMEQQLVVLRQDLLAAQAGLERERARADACKAATTRRADAGHH